MRQPGKPPPTSGAAWLVSQGQTGDRKLSLILTHSSGEVPAPCWSTAVVARASVTRLFAVLETTPHTKPSSGVSSTDEIVHLSPITGTFLPGSWSQEQSKRSAILTRLVVPQEVNGNRNRTKACVAVVGSQSLSFPKARCTEVRSSGGRVTFRDTAMLKWPSCVQREVTGTAEGCAKGRHLSLGQRDQV